MDCHETPTHPECRPIVLVFRIVERLPLLVYMLTHLFQSIFVVLALVGARWRPYIWLSEDRTACKKQPSTSSYMLYGENPVDR